MPERDAGSVMRGLGGLAGRLLAIALLGAVCGCGPSTDPPQASPPAPTPGSIEIREPRALLTPGMGAVYFSVFNAGSKSDRLLRVETPAARAAETHETLMENGMMRMEPRPDGFEVPAGGTLELKPGGKHVMLIELRQAADAVSEIPLTLHFEHAGAIEVRAALLGADAGGS